jgi:hypothetical protein
MKVCVRELLARFGTETIAVTAASLTDTEREQCITRHAAARPWWATTVLAHKAPSQLPVIALVRRGG